MPNPIVTVPPSPLAIDATINTTAENFLTTLLQVFENGTTGLSTSTDETDPTYNPVGGDGSVGPLYLRSREQQLFFRQLGVALAFQFQPGGGGDPGTGTSSAGVIYSAICPAAAMVGDLMRPVVGAQPTVDFAVVTDLASMPAVGVITQKTAITVATIQTSGIVTGVYSGLQPGKRYFTGRDSRPALPADLVPASGELLFHQPIGLAIDYSIMLMSPSMNLTRVRGN